MKWDNMKKNYRKMVFTQGWNRALHLEGIITPTGGKRFTSFTKAISHSQNGYFSDTLEMHFIRKLKKLH